MLEYNIISREQVLGNKFYNKAFGTVVDVVSRELEKCINEEFHI
jgi:hypothetical protein